MERRGKRGNAVRAHLDLYGGRASAAGADDVGGAGRGKNGGAHRRGGNGGEVLAVLRGVHHGVVGDVVEVWLVRSAAVQHLLDGEGWGAGGDGCASRRCRASGAHYTDAIVGADACAAVASAAQAEAVRVAVDAAARAGRARIGNTGKRMVIKFK